MGLSDKTATVAAYTASAGAVASGLSFNEKVAVVGLLFAAATFAVNLTFKWLMYRLQKAKHDAEIKQY